MLEPNHSHFLFVDAGPEAEGQFGKEIALRAELENALCKHTDSEATSSVMLLLVVGGGLGTLVTILETLEKRRPVVVRTQRRPDRTTDRCRPRRDVLCRRV
jgi:hypothetical protein